MKLVDELVNKEYETVEDIGDGVLIIQGTSEFRFGTDAVKLADFATIKPNDSVMDLCTGTGIVPMLLHKKEPKACISGLEIQPQMCEMAQRTVKLNGFTDKINILQGDLRDIRDHFEAESFNVVTCNPPYMKADTGKQNDLSSVTIARHEVMCNLSDCAAAASYLLPSGGRFYMVHRPERLADIISAMREYNIEPKRLTLFAAKNKPPRLLVIEGQKNRNSGMIVHLETGEES